MFENPSRDEETLTPNAILSKILLDSSVEHIVVIALLKNGNVRTAWDDMPQVIRIGMIEAVRLSSAQAWDDTGDENDE